MSRYKSVIRIAVAIILLKPENEVKYNQKSDLTHGFILKFTPCHGYCVASWEFWDIHFVAIKYKPDIAI